MIASHRRLHRTTITILGVMLPVLYGFGLAVRRAIPVNDSLPPTLQTIAPAQTTVSAEQVGFGATTFDIAVAPLAGTGRMIVSIRLSPGASVEPTADAAPAVHGPDVLAYWTDVEPSGSDAVGAATLLGPFDGARPARFEVPETPGFLMLYSLGHDEIVGYHRLGTAPGGNGGS